MKKPNRWHWIKRTNYRSRYLKKRINHYKYYTLIYGVESDEIGNTYWIKNVAIIRISSEIYLNNSYKNERDFCFIEAYAKISGIMPCLSQLKKNKLKQKEKIRKINNEENKE